MSERLPSFEELAGAKRDVRITQELAKREVAALEWIAQTLAALLEEVRSGKSCSTPRE